MALAPFRPLDGLAVLEIGHNSVAATYAGYLLNALGGRVTKLVDPGDALAADLTYGLLNAGKHLVHPAAEGAEESELVFRLACEADAVVTASVLSTDSLAARAARTLTARRPATRLFSLVSEAGAETAAPNCLISASAGMTWGIGEASRDPISVPAELAEYQSGIHLACCVVVDAGLASAAEVVEFVRHEVCDLDIARHNIAENYSIMSTYGIPWEREGRRAAGSAGGYPYGIFPCKDGMVAIIARTHGEWGRLLDAMGRPEWAKDPRFADLRVVAAKYADEADNHLYAWLADLTRAEAAEIGRQYGVPMGPVNTPSELLEDKHLLARGFFQHTTLNDGRVIQLPGLPFTAIPATAATAPQTGAVRRRPSANGGVSGRLPLAGKRVLDLTSTWSGPGTTAFLADLGAEVIKVESLVSLDTNRSRGFEKPGVAVPADLRTVSQSDMCAFDAFRTLNRGKRSVQLCLKNADGLGTFEELVKVSDLIVENRTPGALERLGLGWDRIQQLNPACSLVTLSALGRGGPASTTKGYGPIMSSHAGVESLARYGQDVVGMLTVAYSDANAIPWAVLSSLCGLRQAEQSGQGVHIDISQTEAAAATTFASLVHAQIDGTGNDVFDYDPRPHIGQIRRCADGWVCAYVDRAEGADRAPGLGDSTPSEMTCDEMLASLAREGTAAARVLNYGEMYDRLVRDSSHLIAEVADMFGHTDLISFVPWPTTLGEPIPVPAPLLNEHVVHVLEGVLSKDRRALEALFAAGALY